GKAGPPRRPGATRGDEKGKKNPRRKQSLDAMIEEVGVPPELADRHDEVTDADARLDAEAFLASLPDHLRKVADAARKHGSDATAAANELGQTKNVYQHRRPQAEALARL